MLVVDDEEPILELLKYNLEKNGYEVKTAQDGARAVDIAKRFIPDLVLLDIRLRNTTGVELLGSLKKMELSPKVIAVTGMEGVELIVNLLKLGVDGVVYKLDGYDEIKKTIMSILASENYYPENVRRIIQSNANSWDRTPTVVLKAKELKILKAIARGSITKEIANELKLAEATAETYRLRLIKKLGVTNTAGLLAYAYRNGIL